MHHETVQKKYLFL